MTDRAPLHQERLGVPLRWWVQGTMLVVSLALAFAVSMPPLLAIALTLLLLAVLGAALTAYGSPRVALTSERLRAGRAQIEVTHLGAARALDQEQTRRVAGIEADARAYLLLRPYLKRAVQVAVVDPADPAPYWLICTRRPEQLAAALQSLDQAAAPPGRETR